MLKKIIFFTLFSLLIVYGKTITYTASVSQNEVFLQERFTYTIELKNSNNFPQVSWPQMVAFSVLGYPSQSSNYSIVNNKTTSSKSLTYTLVALQAGEVQIPPVKFVADGKQYVTKPIKMTVYKKKTQKPGQKGISKTHLRLRAIPSKTRVIMGESIVVDYVIETTRDIRSPYLESEPHPDGFLYEQRDDNDLGAWETEIRDGIRIKKAKIMRMVYTPTKSGKLSLKPLKIGLQVKTQQQQRRRNDPFFSNSIFSNNWRRQFLTSDKLDIQVINPPLPRPDSFNGAIGNFVIKNTISANAIKKGESLSYKIKISGSGNFKQFQFPEINLDPNTFDVFEPEKKDAIRFVNGQYTGYREYVWLIVPRKEGEITIPELSWSFINPKTEKYVTRTLPAHTISVATEDNETALYSAGYRREEIQKLNEDIRFIQSSTVSWSKINQQIYHSFAYQSLWGIGLFLMLGSMVYKRYQMHIDANPIATRRRQAYSKAKSALNKIPQDEDYDVQTAKVQSILLAYLGDILNVSSQSLELDAIAQIALEHHIAKQHVDALTQFIHKLNAGRFAPDSFSSDIPMLYNEAFSILDALEKGEKNA